MFELKNIEDPHRTDNLLQDIDALFDNPFNSYKDYISLEEITKLNESIDLAGKNLYDKEMELVQHNDDFIEECICDDMACEYLIDIMKKQSVKTVFISTTAVPDEVHNARKQLGFTRYDRDVKRYNEIALSVMKECDIPVIELGDFTRKLTGELFIDHVHYCEEVRKIQAAYLLGKLENFI